MEKVGYVILYHFDPPYKHARHCWDWAESINDRIRDHFKRSTRGPRLVRVALDAGSMLTVARHWPGTKSNMLVMRNGGNAGKLCPICRQERRMRWQDDNLSELLGRSISLMNS